MKIIELIREGYTEAQTEFAAASTPEAATQTIKQYRDLVTRNQVSGNERNIDFWRKQGWEAFSSFVSNAASVASKTQIKRSKLPGKSINLVDNTNWLVVIPLDKEASCFHGKASDWCVTKPNQSNFEQYFHDNSITLIYCLNKQSGGMWAIAVHTDTDQLEMFDQNNTTINTDKFEHQTGLDPIKLRDMALGPDHKPAVQASRTSYTNALALLTPLLSHPITERSPEIEKLLMYTQHGESSYKYLEKLFVAVGETKLKNIPLPIQIAATNYNGKAILYIDNPSEQIQLAAVNWIAQLIQYIDNPSEQVKLAAVKQYANAIKWIKYPSEQVQLAAVTSGGQAIQHIENPSERVKLAAVKRYGSAIKHIDNPSEELQLAAVTSDGHAIQHIENPTERVKAAARGNR